jgi:TolA-binding protein
MCNTMRMWLVLVWLLLMACPASGPIVFADSVKSESPYDKSRALVIGIEQYAQAAAVPGAVDEAKRVAQAFRQLGFEEITELYNKDATSRRLHQALSDIFTRKVDRSGRVVVFFSGHTGITRDSKGRDLGYLVPVDAQTSKGAKFLTIDTFKELTRRSPSKHTLLITTGRVRPSEALPPKAGSPEGETDTEARAVQVIARADDGEKVDKMEGKIRFIQALLTGLAGAADLNQNGWLMASELGTYLKQQVGAITLRLDGDGDTVVLIQQRKEVPEPSAHTLKDREAAKAEYEQAVAYLQGGKYAEEALARLKRAIEYDPTFGEAYLLKSYLRLEVVPDLDEALAAGQQAVKYAPDNPEAFYTLGLVQEKMGHYQEAEEAFVQAAKLNPKNESVYFSLGTLYEDELNDRAKSVDAFRRYLELGGDHARARAAVSQADQAVVAPADPLP